MQLLEEKKKYAKLGEGQDDYERKIRELEEASVRTAAEAARLQGDLQLRVELPTRTEPDRNGRKVAPKMKISGASSGGCRSLGLR